MTVGVTAGLNCGLPAIIGQAAEDMALPVIVVALAIGGGGWLLWKLADESGGRQIAAWGVPLAAGTTLALLAVRTVQIWQSTC